MINDNYKLVKRQQNEVRSGKHTKHLQFFLSHYYLSLIGRKEKKKEKEIIASRDFPRRTLLSPYSRSYLLFPFRPNPSSDSDAREMMTDNPVPE